VLATSAALPVPRTPAAAPSALATSAALLAPRAAARISALAGSLAAAPGALRGLLAAAPGAAAGLMAAAPGLAVDLLLHGAVIAGSALASGVVAVACGAASAVGVILGVIDTQPCLFPLRVVICLAGLPKGLLAVPALLAFGQIMAAIVPDRPYSAPYPPHPPADAQPPALAPELDAEPITQQAASRLLPRSWRKHVRAVLKRQAAVCVAVAAA
jgi:hypothetical protein